jgi:hypothetical protein
VASHHQVAAIADSDIRRSASGVRREIGSILRAGIVDYPVTSRLPRAGYAQPTPSARAAALPQCDRVVTLLDKIRNVRHGNPGVCPPYWGPI